MPAGYRAKREPVLCMPADPFLLTTGSVANHCRIARVIQQSADLPSRLPPLVPAWPVPRRRRLLLRR